MIIPCYNPCRVCTPFVGGASSPADPDYPFVNLSSEEADVDRFFGRRFNPPYDPPIGDLFFAIGCLGFCASTVSQEDANLCAEQQAMFCLSGEWPQPNPNGPPPTTNRQLFENQQVSCSFNCPDGTPFTFILAPGVISAFSQLAADTAAYSYACDQAIRLRICLTALTPSLTCTEAGYVGSIVASTSTPPLTFTVEGELPPGLVPSSNETTMFITGVPTIPGDYTFGVRAEDRFHNAMTKQMSLTCFGIVNESPLPDAEVGTPYSVTLFTAGTVTGAVTYSVTVGSLPDGLMLNSSTGEISGTPTTEGPVSFTVRATCESIACSKGFGIQVNSSCGVETDVQYIGISGLFATGFNVNVAVADMYNGVPFVGWENNIAVDGKPKILVMNVQWGVGADFWFIGPTVQAGNGQAGGGYASAFDTSVSKSLNIPVFDTGTVDIDILSTAPNAAAMGAAVVTCSFDCPGMGEFNPTWGSVNVSTIGAATGNGTVVGSQFNFNIDNLSGDTVQVDVAGTFPVTGNGITGRLTLQFTNCVIFDANRPKLQVFADSSIDGSNIWANDTSDPAWFTGNGTYTIPVAIACTPGSVITINIVMVSVGQPSSMSCVGTFSAW